jgi:hypothetical protein
MVVPSFQLRWSFPVIPLAGAVAWGLVQLAGSWTIDSADPRVAVLTCSGNVVAFFLGMQVRGRFLNGIVYLAF